MVRNTLKYVADKDMKSFANDLKTVYHAPDEQTARNRLEEVTRVWNEKYPGSMNRWNDHWDVISPMFKFSQTVREVIYTTNAIESLNSGYGTHVRMYILSRFGISLMPPLIYTLGQVPQLRFATNLHIYPSKRKNRCANLHIEKIGISSACGFR